MMIGMSMIAGAIVGLIVEVLIIIGVLRLMLRD